MEKVLITGISGVVGRLLARRLRSEAEVCGCDLRPWTGHPQGIRVHPVELHKRAFEEVMAKEQPDAVIHMGFDQRGHHSEERHDRNLRGTQNVFETSQRFGVERVVVLSSGNAYGAAPDNPFGIEEDRPLAASRNYPEIRDLVEMDTLACAALWKHSEGQQPDARIAVLRPVNILGEVARSPLANLLRRSRVPTLMGFDPPVQVIHERDVVEAVVLTLNNRLRGVYNVVGPGQVPLHVAIRACGGTPWPLPEFLVRPIFRRLLGVGLPAPPPGVLDYLKYPVVLAGKRFQAATQFTPLFGLAEIFEAMKR